MEFRQQLKRAFNRIRTFWNSEYTISVFNFRKVNTPNGLPRPTQLKGIILDESERVIGERGGSKHVTHPEGWLALLTKTENVSGLRTHTELMQLENSEYVILIKGENIQ